MHTEQKAAPISVWLRFGGTLTGAVLGALAAAVLFFLAAVLDTTNGTTSFAYFATAMSLAGCVVGFLHPRNTLHSLWFLFPDICG
jgi:hypothetical protein